MEVDRSSAPDDEIGPTDRDRDGRLPSAEPAAAMPAEPTAAEPVDPDEDGWVPL
ncbi:hypothetical protein OHA77_29060 [Streptosporangium sp. NBC_01639]|uniref:hypothetical protein n=1 Tax=Streptosporangium sp. NBC_01639 TaxID=2975948 RepID=UPI00386FD7F8|nr:hypothetical protein OHA77_29060 [Streptosporangium sp. NBC_01639]